MKHYKKEATALMLGTALFSLASAARAVCDPTAHPMDLTVWHNFAVEPCTTERTYAYVAEFNLSALDFGKPAYLDDTWGGWLIPDSGERGVNNPCDPNYELGKHWAAGMVVKHGTRWEERVFYSGGVDIQLNRAFHAPSDYLEIAKGQAAVVEEFRWTGLSLWHPNYVHHVRDELHGGYYGLYEWDEHVEFDPLPRAETDYTVTHGCLAFSPGLNAGAYPSYRASSFIHEGWHAHFGTGHGGDHVSDPQHQLCKIDECDHYYPHARNDFGEGELMYTGVDQGRHSANQLQHEFLCDLANLPATWVGFEVWDSAATEAEAIGLQRFVGGPIPFGCGVPTPMWGGMEYRLDDPGGGGGGCESACSTGADCAARESCEGGCCIWVG